MTPGTVYATEQLIMLYKSRGITTEADKYSVIQRSEVVTLSAHNFFISFLRILSENYDIGLGYWNRIPKLLFAYC